MNQNFPKYGICAGTQQIMYIFIIEQIQSKLMTKFFSKFKKPVFGQFFFHFPNFQKNFSGKSRSITHNFIWVSNSMPKFRKN